MKYKLWSECQQRSRVFVVYIRGKCAFSVRQVVIISFATPRLRANWVRPRRMEDWLHNHKLVLYIMYTGFWEKTAATLNQVMSLSGYATTSLEKNWRTICGMKYKCPNKSSYPLISDHFWDLLIYLCVIISFRLYVLCVDLIKL